MRATLFLLLLGIAPLANAAGMMDTLVSQVQAASGGWMSSALGYAKTLFFGLAAIEFAWSAIQLTLKKSELSEIMVGTLFKVMSLSFFAMVLIKAPEWIPAIINSFKVAGAGVGGTSVLSPSAVFDQGLQVAASLMQFSNDAAPSTGSMIINTLTNSGQGLGKFMLSSIIVGVASVFIILGYGLIAVQLLITLVESYLIIGGGALMLGFSGSRWTHNLSEKYFGYAISIGVKLFTIYLIIGFGDSFTQALKDTIAAAYAAHPEGPSFGEYLGVGGASLFYGVTGYMAPGLAGSMLNGTVAMSLQSAGTAAGMVGGAPVAAGLATSAAGARALGLAGGAMGTLIPIQKPAGAIGGSSAGVGFSGGISGAVNPVNPFQASASTSATTSTSNGGQGVPGKPGATEQTGLAGGLGTGSRFGTTSYDGAPSPSGSPAAWQDLTASSQNHGQTEAAGFVDPRFDPSAGPRAGRTGNGHQSSNETGGMSANSFDARSAQQRFEADYKQKPGSVADKLNSFSKRLQYAADRRKPHWASDGHVGHAPGLRMGLDS
jgi:type IV secretion system protein TrbL